MIVELPNLIVCGSFFQTGFSQALYWNGYAFIRQGFFNLKSKAENGDLPEKEKNRDVRDTTAGSISVVNHVPAGSASSF